MTDPFDTLGLEPAFELDTAVLESRYRDLQRALHPDRHVQAPEAERRASLARAVSVNEAYRRLRDELGRAEALIVRLGGLQTKASGPADPEFLMQVMELREGLSEAKAEGDLDAAGTLSARVEAMQREVRDELVAGFSALLGGGVDAAGLERVSGALDRLRYYRRFQDEVAVIEEEASG